MWPTERSGHGATVLPAQLAEDVLPIDVWQLIWEQMGPLDLVTLSAVCRAFRRGSLDDGLWERLLEDAASTAVNRIALPRQLEAGADVVSKVLRAAARTAHEQHGKRSASRTNFFLALPHVAQATVSVLAAMPPSASPDGSPPLCFVSLDRRAYDTSDFAARHPGGEMLMRDHHGADVSAIFDAFPHSMHAHDMMRAHMLRFDAVEQIGAPGAPSFAREAAPLSWSIVREATGLFDLLRGDRFPFKWPPLSHPLSNAPSEANLVPPEATPEVHARRGASLFRPLPKWVSIGLVSVVVSYMCALAVQRFPSLGPLLMAVLALSLLVMAIVSGVLIATIGSKAPWDDLLPRA